MTKEQLLERKHFYEDKKTELASKSYDAEIEEELAIERKRIEAKYENQKRQDCQKVDHYIELLTELIVEAAKEEALKLAEEAALVNDSTENE